MTGSLGKRERYNCHHRGITAIAQQDNKVDKAGLSVEDVQHLLSHGIPMSEGMGVIVDGLPEGGAVLRVPYSDSLVRPGGTISGPVMMALADAAMYAAILGRLGAVIMAVTANLNIHFLHRPGKM